MRLLYVTSGRHDQGIWHSINEWLTRKGHSVCPFRAEISWNAGKALEDQLIEPLPDALMVIGDRWEYLLCALAATKKSVPIIHFHGGEVSLGSFDQQTRDAITKLSSLHLTAGTRQRERVISLGEYPSTVYAIGAPGSDWYWNTNPVEIPKEISSLDTSEGLAFLMLQPETLSGEQSIMDSYRAAVTLAASKPWALLVAEPVEDPGWLLVKQSVSPLYSRSNTLFYKHLPPPLFWKLLKQASMVIGNSSCIPLECAPLGIPYTLYGNRQDGRLPPDKNLLDGKAGQRAASIIENSRPYIAKRLALPDLTPYHSTAY